MLEQVRFRFDVCEPQLFTHINYIMIIILLGKSVFVVYPSDYKTLVHCNVAHVRTRRLKTFLVDCQETPWTVLEFCAPCWLHTLRYMSHLDEQTLRHQNLKMTTRVSTHYRLYSYALEYNLQYNNYLLYSW